MLESYSPVEWFLKTIRYWWLVTGFMIAGGLCGLLINNIRPNVFEASSVISVGIDYSRVGLLTDIEEDQIVEIVGDVIASKDVFNRVSVRALDDGLTEELVIQDNAFLERKNFRWILRVRTGDSDLAARLVDLWVEEAVKELDTAYSHALIADSYTGYLESLVSCLEQTVALDNGQVFCSAANLKTIQAEIKKVNQELTKEKLASKGIFPGVSFAISTSGESFAVPIKASKNLYVLGGSLIGLLVSFFVISSLSKREY